VLGGGDSLVCVGSTCRTSSCGDGHTNLVASEQCDSNGVDSAACVGATCRSSTCGDGYRNNVANEECDDGNGRGRDGCGGSCKAEDAVVLVPGATPPLRRTAGMAYDAARQRVVMFGGFNGAFLNDTWEWDGAAWTQMFPRTVPGGRAGHGLAYDAARHRVVMFGGQNTAGGIAETWEWDGTNWALMSPTGTPPTARTLPAMGYDGNRRRVIMYGGLDTVATTGFEETWEWTGTAWNKLTTGGTSPGPRYGGSLAFDSTPARRHSVMFGGNPNGRDELDVRRLRRRSLCWPRQPCAHGIRRQPWRGGVVALGHADLGVVRKCMEHHQQRTVTTTRRVRHGVRRQA
jgi:cysteine-rich repeat protein